MRKLSALLGLILAGSSLLSIEAQAASPKTGLRCSKLNQTVTSSGFTYTCMKVGKKLVWSKGVKIPAPMPSPSASPTFSPTPTPTPTPTPSPSASPKPSPTPTTALTPPVPPTSFQDLSTHLSGVITGSWMKASEQARSGASNLGNVKLLIGPNTTPNDASLENSMAISSQLYSTVPQVKNIIVVEYGQADMNWAQDQYSLLHPKNYSPTYVAHSCSNGNCNSGCAGVTNDGTGVLLIGVSSSHFYGPTDAINAQFAAKMTMHEYIHTIQMFNAPCQAGGCYGMLPTWLLEGNAEWSAEIAASKGDFQQYLLFRKDLLDGLYTGFYKDADNFSPAWLTNYLNPNPVWPINGDYPYWNNFPNDFKYNLGLMVNEILGVLKGPGAIMNLFVDVGQGLGFIDAFQKEFGISWSEACPEIADAISKEINQGIKD